MEGKNERRNESFRKFTRKKKEDNKKWDGEMASTT